MSYRYPIIIVTLLVSIGTFAHGETDAGRFQALIAGEWQGKAVHTPIGPTPYDIEFRKQNDLCLIGTAYNGFTHHTWVFCDDQGDLKLDFLSDFRGNDLPIHFKLVSEQEAIWTFHADSHDFMDVLMTIRENSGWIKIMHHGKLHVQINLER